MIKTLLACLSSIHLCIQASIYPFTDPSILEPRRHSIFTIDAPTCRVSGYTEQQLPEIKPRGRMGMQGRFYIPLYWSTETDGYMEDQRHIWYHQKNMSHLLNTKYGQNWSPNARGLFKQTPCLGCWWWQCMSCNKFELKWFHFIPCNYFINNKKTTYSQFDIVYVL